MIYKIIYNWYKKYFFENEKKFLLKKNIDIKIFKLFWKLVLLLEYFLDYVNFGYMKFRVYVWVWKEKENNKKEVYWLGIKENNFIFWWKILLYRYCIYFYSD